MKYYILMADIIGSREKEQQKLISDFKNLVSKTNSSYKKRIASPLTITLGDEFQGVIKDLGTALQIMLVMEETIVHHQYNFKLRYILHQGEIETSINKKKAYEMLGGGLADARLELDELKGEKSRFSISLDDPAKNEMLGNAFYLYQYFVDQWDVDKDYAIVSGFIKYGDYKMVADHIGRNRSLIWKRERTLNIGPYNKVKNIIKAIIAQS